MEEYKYKIKQIPEDFLVTEDAGSAYEISSSAEFGEYLVFRMRKKNYTTENAVQQITRSLNMNRKQIGYAGAKDSRAITLQNISISTSSKGVSKEKVLGLHLKDIELEFLGYSNGPISLGDLAGNSFEIVIRNLNANQTPKIISKFINYFGEQRFSINNAYVGLAIIRKDFKRATELICESSADDKEKITDFLAKNKNDYVGALKQIPWKTLTLYIHALQSRLWNDAAKKYCEKHHSGASSEYAENIELPLVGFATDFENKEIEKIYSELLAKDKISQNDFVIRQIPDLTSAGTRRLIFSQVHNLNIGELEDDELNANMKKCKVTFFLGKGCYATEAIQELMQ